MSIANTTTPRPSVSVPACNVGALRNALAGLPDDMRIVLMTTDADEGTSYADLYMAEVATYVEEPDDKGARYIPEVRDLGDEDDAETVLFLIPC
ncbi:hypothetical protein ACFY05_32025 [Microtetraspora fusca]|uniref:Uncharacterized protein n=1 Tax=Microtetraspora fusca TaxID=1997 RepID=A0ABW6VDS4_MICFU